MERIIKFRGKRVDNGEWVYGHLLHCNPTCSVDMSGKDMSTYYIVPLRFNIPALKPVMVSPETVGQFTGLFDKKGSEIFEGDIITSDEIHTRAIMWNSYECKFNAVEWGMHTAIILGNIHDNSELLKPDSE